MDDDNACAAAELAFTTREDARLEVPVILEVPDIVNVEPFLPTAVTDRMML